MTKTFYNLRDLDDTAARTYLENCTADQLLTWYFQTKGAVATYEAAVNEHLRPYKEQLELIDFLLSRKMDADDVKSLKTAAGSVTRAMRTAYKVVDMDAVMKDAMANDRLHLHKLTPIKEEVEAEIARLRAEGKDVDGLPGIELTSSSYLRYTAAKA